MVVAEFSWLVVMGCSQLYEHGMGDGVLAVTKDWLGPRVVCDQGLAVTKGRFGPRAGCDFFSCEDACVKSKTLCMIRMEVSKLINNHPPFSI
jgi:hypothetical protein